ncbi:RNA-binding protein pno1-like protein, partial [Drosera capensis]
HNTVHTTHSHTQTYPTKVHHHLLSFVPTLVRSLCIIVASHLTNLQNFDGEFLGPVHLLFVHSSMEVDGATPAPNSEPSSLPAKLNFGPLTSHEISAGVVQFRRVSVPPHRYTPLKKAWLDIYNPIYNEMKIDIRMNLKSRKVELKTKPETPDISNLQKCADFVQAFMLGFDIPDAIALLRLDELYIESFEIKDVKTLRGEHLSRAIGRLSGKGGKTKFAIENATRTRIVIADTKIHILGSFASIKVARDSLCSLILGSPAGKVYSKLRAVAARLAERF